MSYKPDCGIIIDELNVDVSAIQMSGRNCDGCSEKCRFSVRLDCVSQDNHFVKEDQHEFIIKPKMYVGDVKLGGVCLNFARDATLEPKENSGILRIRNIKNAYKLALHYCRETCTNSQKRK